MSELTSNSAAPGAPAGPAQTGVPVDRARAAELGAFARFFKATELDTRMLGMIAALLVIWFGFHILTGGLFLTPRNLWNLSVQSSSIAIMATGMVLVIVTRNIDLSVGSILGFVGMIMGVLQAEIFPRNFGIELGSPVIWIGALAVGLLLGTLIGGFQGFLIAYGRIPSFIVTLGGLLVWRGAAWWVTTGRTVAPMDATFRLLGGGPAGSVGAAASWIVGLLACAAVVFLLINERRQRLRFRFPLRPVWAEAFLGIVACVVILGAVMVANAYYWPAAIANRYAQANNVAVPEGGLLISHGLAIPVLLAIIVGIVMTFLSNRTRFGRYVFAIGGNPEAADLAGIRTRWITVKIFALMGLLAAVASAVSTARLNAATNAQGTLDELLTIAAAVIGGTSLAGGSGTIAGAMLGAVLMQSLSSGMTLLGVESTLQSIAVGIVLVLAVWVDTIYRRRVG